MGFDFACSPLVEGMLFGMNYYLYLILVTLAALVIGPDSWCLPIRVYLLLGTLS